MGYRNRKTATKEDANEVIAHIRKTVAEKFGEDAAQKIRIQYGGSMKPANAAGAYGDERHRRRSYRRSEP